MGDLAKRSRGEWVNTQLRKDIEERLEEGTRIDLKRSTFEVEKLRYLTYESKSKIR